MRRLSSFVIISGITVIGFSAAAQTPPGAPAPKTEATRTLTITVPEEGQHFVRPLPSADAKEPAQLPHGFMGPKASVTYDTAGLGKSPRLAVDDPHGNTAIVPPAGKFVSGDTLELHRIDFDHVHRVEVKVTYDNKPVQAARVTLTAGEKVSQSKTIDPASQGVAVFEDAPSGKAKLTIKYGDNLTQTSDVVITPDHPGDKLALAVVVTNKVPTLDVPAGGSAPIPAGAPAQPSPGIQPVPAEPPSGGGLAGLVGTLISLAVAGGVIYLLYRWAQSGGMAATLKKMGVEVSGPAAPSDAGTPWNPNAPPAPVVSDPSMCQFCGQKKDAAGNCACTLSGAALNTGPTSPAIPTQPRLVATIGAYSGTVFPLSVNGGPLTVGREPTNTISLADDTTVSRRHASIRVDNGTYVVTDEGSSNGVYVNGAKIAGSQALRPGDEVQIGNTRFRFEV